MPEVVLKEKISVEEAMGVLRGAMQEDDDYAWGWHCNIACMCQDAGATHSVANDGAARFMKLCFGVDTRKPPVASNCKKESEIELPKRYEALRAKFKLGDWVVGLGEHKGCSQVFEGYGFLQPFEYLNDFDPDNYRIATDEEIAEAEKEFD